MVNAGRADFALIPIDWSYSREKLMPAYGQHVANGRFARGDR